MLNLNITVEIATLPLKRTSDFRFSGVVPEPADKVAEEARGGDGDGKTTARGG